MNGCPTEIRPLTALRGIVALWVVVYHLVGSLEASGLTDGPNGALANLTRGGQFGVDIFFMLSGYVITMSYEQRGYLSFVGRRCARIFPLHVVVMLAMAVGVTAIARLGVTPRDEKYFSADTFGFALTLTNTWFGLPPSWNNPTWSLSVEFGIYLAFPMLFALLPKTGACRLAVMAACLLADSATLSLIGFSITGVGAMLRGVLGFCAGAMLRLGGWNAGICSPTAIGAAILLLCALGQYWLAVFPAALLIITLADVRRRNSAFWLMSSAPMVWLGRISFSVYLTHVPLLILFTVVAKRSGGVANGHVYVSALAFVSIVILVASVTFVIVERPSRILLRGGFFPSRRIDVRMRGPSEDAAKVEKPMIENVEDDGSRQSNGAT